MPDGTSMEVSGRSSTSIYSNYAWSVLNLFLAKGLRFAGVLICIRQVGILTWGEVAAALVTITLLGFAVDQGLGSAPQVFKVQDRGMDGALLRKISLYRLVMAVGIIASLHIIGRNFSVIGPLVATYSLVLVPRALNVEWLFHRREQYHVTMAIGSARTLLFFCLAALLIGKSATANTVIIIEILAETGGLLFSYAFLWKQRDKSAGRESALSLRTLLLFSVPVLLTGILDGIPAYAEILFLKHFVGLQAVGEYDIGSKIGLFYFFFGAALIQIVLPKLARLHAAGENGKMAEILGSSSKLLLLLSTALIIPSFYYPDEILRFVFGHEYPLTVFAFQLIPVWVFVSFATMLNTIVLLGTGRRKDYLYGAILACTVNLLGNWIFIGLFSAFGVVFARILSESVLFLYAFARLPSPLRTAMSRNMGLQAMTLILLVSLFLVSGMSSHRWIFALLSTVLWLGVVVAQKTLTRGNLKVLMAN